MPCLLSHLEVHADPILHCGVEQLLLLKMERIVWNDQTLLGIDTHARNPNVVSPQNIASSGMVSWFRAGRFYAIGQWMVKTTEDTKDTDPHVCQCFSPLRSICVITSH